MPKTLTADNLTTDDIKACFDDYVYDGERDDGDNGEIYEDYWVYVCPTHAKEFGHLGTLDDSPIAATCSVIGCQCECSDYLDLVVTYPVATT